MHCMPSHCEKRIPKVTQVTLSNLESPDVLGLLAENLRGGEVAISHHLEGTRLRKSKAVVLLCHRVEKRSIVKGKRGLLECN